MVNEVEYVDECPQDNCDVRFVGASPDDVREHLAEYHHGILGKLIVFPTEAERRRQKEGVSSD